MKNQIKHHTAHGDKNKRMKQNSTNSVLSAFSSLYHSNYFFSASAVVDFIPPRQKQMKFDTYKVSPYSIPDGAVVAAVVWSKYRTKKNE